MRLMEEGAVSVVFVVLVDDIFAVGLNTALGVTSFART